MILNLTSFSNKVPTLQIANFVFSDDEILVIMCLVCNKNFHADPKIIEVECPNCHFKDNMNYLIEYHSKQFCPNV